VTGSNCILNKAKGVEIRRAENDSESDWKSQTFEMMAAKVITLAAF
jgi:hypothetical protein